MPAEIEKYGFDRWDPPDAGANQDIDQAGGGNADNDGRFMDSKAPGRAKARCSTWAPTAAQQQPFFMVISLVNPHDVLFYPKVWHRPATDKPALQGKCTHRRPSTRTSGPSPPYRRNS